MAEVTFADRFAWFDRIVVGAFRGSEVRVAWAIVRALDERSNSVALKQPAIASEMSLGKKTVEQAVQALRLHGFIATDVRGGAGQANLYRLQLPDASIASDPPLDRDTHSFGWSP